MSLLRFVSVLLVLLANASCVNAVLVPRRNSPLDNTNTLAERVNDKGNATVTEDGKDITPEKACSSTIDYPIHENDNDNDLQDDRGASALTLHEEQIVAVYQKASQSTVSVLVLRHGGRFGIGGQSYSQGSGFLWDASGHVVTAYHVVYDRDNGHDSKAVSVSFDSHETTWKAIIVGADKTLDIAVLRLTEQTDLSLAPLLPRPVDMGNSSQVLIGQTVAAIGHPLDLRNHVTVGVIAAKKQCKSSKKGGFAHASAVPCIILDGRLKSGYSGGPLVDSQGQLIGVLIGMYADFEALGIAVAVNPVAGFVNALLKDPLGGAPVRKKWWNRLLGEK